MNGRGGAAGATAALLLAAGCTGVRVEVTDAATGEPLADVPVWWDETGRDHSRRTGSDGAVRMPRAGTHLVVAGPQAWALVEVPPTGDRVDVALTSRWLEGFLVQPPPVRGYDPARRPDPCRGCR